MKKFFIILIYSLALCALSAIFAIAIVGCKPSMPVKEDFTDKDGNVIMPCYISAVIAVTNTYTEQKTPIDDSVSKCYRYTDYNKCKDDKDPDECWSKLGIRK